MFFMIKYNYYSMKVNMVKYNYHTHTFRCGHAVGTDEEYVIEAIKAGIKELGFSDHVILRDHSQKGTRGDYSLLPDYINSIESLREKYKDQIKIYLGFEAEAMPYYFDYYKELLNEGHIEYFILGNHWELDEHNNLSSFFFHSTTTTKIIKRYTSSLIRGMKTGLFKFVAHPDLFMLNYAKWNKTTIKCSEEICKWSLKLDIPLEFNFGPIRSGLRIINGEERYTYPYFRFWEIVKKYGCKVILGLDVHNPKDIATDRNNPGYELANKLELNIIDKITIK